MNKVDNKGKKQVLCSLRLADRYVDYFVSTVIALLKNRFDTLNFLLLEKKYAYVKDNFYDPKKDLKRLLRD